MPPATDALIGRLAGESQERSQFLDGLVEQAQAEGRDLSEQEMELVTRTRERLGAIAGQLDPLREASRIARESQERTRLISAEIDQARRGGAGPPAAVEYRSAGDYVMDVWRSGLGSDEAETRLEVFHRAAAHQTTADNPGLLPEQILGPVISFIDASRPVVSALGPRQLPSGSWSRPRITQHTNVAPQAGEKTELVSRKMTISKIPVTAQTYGGYVNVSRQDIDWTSPGIMDIVIADLAAVYAQETEKAMCAALDAASTPGQTLPADATSEDVVGAIWSAIGVSYGATKGQGRALIGVSPDMLGLVGPLFPPINPSNASSAGFSAGAFGTGNAGSVSGVEVVCSAGFDAGTMLVVQTAAVEAYEDRIGSLQVVEPSVLGVQVAYAGYFAPLILEATGTIIEITKTP